MSKTISQLPIASTVASADVFPLDQGGLTKQATLSVIAAGLPSATGTGGLVRQVDPVFGNVAQAESNIFCSFQLKNTAAPLDKKYVRFVNNTSGVASIQRVDDAYTIGFNVIGIDVNNNVGIGTDSPSAKLHVAGGDFLIENNRKIAMPDASGSQPYFITQIDNNWVFYGTNSTGGVRPILTTIVRSDTEPLNVNIPLRINVSGSPIQSLISAVANLTLGTIPANGGVQTFDLTVTGATVNSSVTINITSALSNSSIIFKADCVSANTVRIYFVNPTASSVLLNNANYRITVINF